MILGNKGEKREIKEYQSSFCGTFIACIISSTKSCLGHTVNFVFFQKLEQMVRKLCTVLN